MSGKGKRTRITRCFQRRSSDRADPASCVGDRDSGNYGVATAKIGHDVGYYCRTGAHRYGSGSLGTTRNVRSANAYRRGALGIATTRCCRGY